MAKPEQMIATHTRRFNLGDYQHSEYTVSGPVEGDLDQHLISLKKSVEAAHAHSDEAAEPVKETAPAKSAKKAAPKKAAKVEEEENEEEETPEEEELEDADEETEDESEESEEEIEDEEEVETPKPTKGSKKASKAPEAEEPPAKKFKKKGSEYSRNNELHKKLFAAEMKRINPKFMTTNKEAAKAISMKLNGTDFLDAEGVITPAFTKELTKQMKAAK